jgi:hypothetical protein
MHQERLFVRRGDASGFLPAMLQGVQSQIDQIRRFGMAINPHDSTLFVEAIEYFVFPLV